MKVSGQPVIIGIDIGNSSVKAARLSGGKVIGKVRRQALKGPGRPSPGRLSELVEPLAGAGRSRRLSGVIISSVVPALTPAAEAAARRLTPHPPVVVSHRLRFPFKLGVKYPQAVGVDRLVAAAGAVARRRRQAVIIDVGSAITIDLVFDRVFRGGFILAGPDLALGALAERTAQLPALTFPGRTGRGDHAQFIRTTAGAMTSGAHIQVIGGIREAARALDRITGRKLPRIITGGGFPAVSRQFGTPAWQHVPDLVLRGLFQVWKLNQPRR